MLRVVLVLGLAILCTAAPKSRNKGPQLVYDQKQKGDYNIQVHLKNFQVIALLGDDGTGGFGDYDYNYDYGEFTNKPLVRVTQDSEKSTVAPEASTDDKLKPPSSEKPLDHLGEIKPPGSEQQPLENVSDNSKPSTIKEDIVSSSTPKNDDKNNSETVAADSIPGQIQVQVLQSPEDYANFATKKAGENSSAIDSTSRANEKRCSTGFTKDKKGRCRRLRKPQSAIPFDFGRLAHLASRFRSVAADGASNVKFTALGPEKK
ncbi:hypothetical protein WA026_016035 [Henosepilachna vigintioctopunctata]|uniref:Uncharacterized protein n=1 Tax=Henosepilachna vigintioctopunctata TaxID=420089 RepID=A0AAW1U8R2_9CUCU